MTVEFLREKSKLGELVKEKSSSKIIKKPEKAV
jgi:hypothetical protein